MYWAGGLGLYHALYTVQRHSNERANVYWQMAKHLTDADHFAWDLKGKRCSFSPECFQIADRGWERELISFIGDEEEQQIELMIVKNERGAQKLIKKIKCHSRG